MALANRLRFRWRILSAVMLILLCRCVWGAPEAFCDHMIVIANQSVPADKLTGLELKNIFTGKIKLWENGDKIILVYSKQKETQIHFFKEYIKKTPQQFINSWRNLIFMGKSSTIPKGMADEKELIKYVSLTKGAIGYVASQKLIDGVKIISVDKEVGE